MFTTHQNVHGHMSAILGRIELAKNLLATQLVTSLRPSNKLKENKETVHAAETDGAAAVADTARASTCRAYLFAITR